jgi:ankyrin repeat protein
METINQTEKNGVINKFTHIIKNKNIESLITFINHGANVNVQNDNEPPDVDKCSKNFYSPSILFNHQWTPIMYAIYYKKNDFLETLLINKADPNICEYYGLSPFIIKIY